MIQVFIIPVNPIPWRVPPFSPGRHPRSGKLYIKAGRDDELHFYQDSVKEVILRQQPVLVDPPYQLKFWFWRNLEDEHAQIADSTNMQKACEDALQGVVIHNDVDVEVIKSERVAAGSYIPGLIVLEVRNGENIIRESPPSAEYVYKYLEELKHKLKSIEAHKVNNQWPPKG